MNLSSRERLWQVLRKLKASLDGADPPEYHMYNNVNIDGMAAELDRYHQLNKGTNWLTDKYLDVMKLADADPSINFRMHCITLYRGGTHDTGELIGGEVGFSIGRVYTSLSGFKSVDGAGHIQLACLGLWLEARNYAFWSMGHCYSPELDYKRLLGHRVYPRIDFLEELHQHRGPFSVDGEAACGEASEGFEPLQDGDELDFTTILNTIQ